MTSTNSPLHSTRKSFVKETFAEELDRELIISNRVGKGVGSIEKLPTIHSHTLEISLNTDMSSPIWLCDGTHSHICIGDFLPGKSPVLSDMNDDSKSPLFCFLYPKAPQEKFIVKILKESSAKNPTALLELEREKIYLLRMSHKNIVDLIAFGVSKVAEKADRPFIVLEKLNGGSLAAYLKKPRPFHSRPFGLLEFFVASCELTSAIAYLHSGIHSDIVVIHRDLKPDNIGLTSSGRIKLMDFGLCTSIPRSTGDTYANDTYELTGETGSMRYMANEVALKQQYNEKVDIYSLGLILYEMGTGVTPFQGFSKANFMNEVVGKGERPPLDIDEYGRRIKVGDQVVAMLARSWDADFRLRPRATEVLEVLTKHRANAALAQETFVGSAMNFFFSRNY
jgi:serine/threonine protein kinase